MLRTVLATSTSPVYSASWSRASDSVTYATGKSIHVKPLQPAAKGETWKAHDGIVLAVDWNEVNEKILSGSEDRKYKVWDSYGQILYSSAAHDHPINSLRWSPDGNLFGVGSYNTLRMCDQAGWSHSLSKPKNGAIYTLAWSNDGTRLAAGCADGNIVFGNVLEQRIDWRDFEVVLKTEDTIEVRDIHTNTVELLTDFRDRVVKMSMAYGHLVVATTAQCLIYKTTNWHTPVVFELKPGTLRYIKQSRDMIMLLDNVNGIQIYTYEGRLVSSPRLANFRVDLINDDLVSLARDVIAIRDQRDVKVVHMLDVTSGQPIGKPMQHTIEIAALKIDQSNSSTNRVLAIVDKNRDLFVMALRRSRVKMSKLGTMVQTLCWHEETSMLSAISNGKFTTWYYPAAAFVDPEILSKTRSDRDASEFGKNPVISGFYGNACVIKRADGAIMPVNVSPYPATLHKYVVSQSWDDAIRVCRFVKDETLWACLAAMAVAQKELNAAEIAYAAIDEVDKVQYIAHIKSIPTVEGRNAQMALFSRELDEAEAILLQAGLIFRAIEMNCKMFRFERGLELAVKHKTHIDTVLAWRQTHLQRFRSVEQNKKFIQFSKGVEIDYDAITVKIEAEAENERSRPGAVPYS